MKISMAKRLFSGFMAAMTFLSTWGMTSVTTMASGTDYGYPELSEVIGELDEDEIVLAGDYEVPAGSDFDIRTDLSGFDIPDMSKVRIVFDEAKDADGQAFTADRTGDYTAAYHVDPVSGHPSYRLSRNIRVREVSKKGNAFREMAPATTSPGASSGSASDSGVSSQDNTLIPPETDSSISGSNDKGAEKGDRESESDDSEDAPQPGKDKESTGIFDIGKSDDMKSGKDSSTPDDPAKGSTGDVVISEPSTLEETLVGADGAVIDSTVNCISGSFGSVYVNHAYQTSGNSGGDRIVYCGEVDMHFSSGPHTRQNLVGTSLQGHVVTEADVIRVGLMQNYFFHQAGVSTDVARGLTQRAVWAMAVGDTAASVNNPHWLEVSGLLGVYQAGQAYAAANASKYVIKEAYALVSGDSQKLVYIEVKEKPKPTITPTPTSNPTPTSTPTPTPTPKTGKGKVVKKSSDDGIAGNDSYSLAGAVYGVYSDSNCTKKITELVTDADGATKEHSLEAGTYYVKEITAPKNFKLNDKVYTLTVQAEKTAVVNAEDAPEKGSVSLLKVSAEGSTLPVKGTQYTVYKDKGCTEPAGVLTVGEDGKSNVLSLYYGTFYVKETNAAPGYMLDTTVHTVKLESTKPVELKLTDKLIRIELSTTAKNDKAKTQESEHIALAEKKTEITDTVSYKGLIVGRTYTFKTILMDKDTGKAVKDADGKDIALEIKLKVNTGNRDGTVNIPIVFDATSLAGHSVVVFEYLYDEDGIEVGKHEDLEDESQTIVFPKAETEASDEVTATNIVMPSKDIRVKDILVYHNLLVGKEYLVTGTLMDKKTGKAVLDDEGNEVRSTKKFTAEKKNGSVEILFTFSGVKLGGTVMVAFEKVSISGVEIMTHTDINDDDQTVYVPSIATTAADKETGSKEIPSEGKRVITDHVEYKAFPKGRYVMKGILMDKETGKECKDAKGKAVKAETAFEVTEENGTVDMDFTVDGETFAGKQVVVFEKAYRVKEDGTAEDKPVAVHEEIDDEAQTVIFPEIATILVDKATEDHYAFAAGTVTHIDTVRYSGLTTGKKYTVKGKLVDKKTGEPVLDEGNAVTAEKEFTPDKPEGTVDIEFTFNASALAGETIVAFETLHTEGRQIASHADIDDEDQTIHYPKIGTVLTAGGTDSHTGSAEKTLSLTDTVTYSNLIPGKEYSLDGLLFDKTDGSEVKVNGESVRATTGFTPEKPDGTVQLTFKVDATTLAGKSLVAIEVLFLNGKEVAIHADLEDEAQTVDIPGISTSFIGNETNSHMAPAIGEQKFTDSIFYTNLTPGKEYTVKGTLMDKESGKAFAVNGKKVTAEKTFKPESRTGKVDLTFTLDTSALAGKSIVAFEYLYEDKRQIAVHADINDEEQTVRIPQIRTVAADGADADKNIAAAKNAVVKDTVTMKNFLPRTKLRLEAVLVDVASGGTLKVGGSEVRGSKTVTVQGADDTAEVEIKFDATGLKGKYVVFERAYIEDSKTPIAIHEDLKDTDQTVNIQVQQVTVKLEGKPTTTPSRTTTTGGTVTSKASPVKTGDENNIAVRVIALLLSAVCITALLFTWKRKKGHKGKNSEIIGIGMDECGDTEDLEE